MSLSSLNITEQIYSIAGGQTSHYLIQSRARDGVWELALWLRPNAQEPNNLQLWIGIGEDTSNVDEVCTAMLKGDMSVDVRPNGGRKLTIHTISKKNSVYLDAAPVSENVGLLLDGAFQLRAQREEGNVAELQAKLDEANIEKQGGRIRAQQAELQRAAHTGPQSPPKKAPPKGASQLQPYQKRRKRQENVFADSDDDEDHEDEEEYSDDGEL